MPDKISIIPNTEAKKSIESQVSLLEYLPKNTVIWTQDIKYSKGILDDYFEKLVKDIMRMDTHLKFLEMIRECRTCLLQGCR